MYSPEISAEHPFGLVGQGNTLTFYDTGLEKLPLTLSGTGTFKFGGNTTNTADNAITFTGAAKYEQEKEFLIMGEEGTTSRLTVSGPGTFQVDSTMRVGHDGRDGELYVKDGATVNFSGEVRIGGNASTRMQLKGRVVLENATINNTASVKESDDFEKAKRLSDILSKAKSLNENIFNDSHDYRFSTYLDFNPQWGLGSSSTLINNISEWADINPYQLLEMTFKGSGYDIACAKANGAIFYRVNESRAADFNPSFKDNLYFVYQGHKQNSANEVKAFLDKEKSYDDEVMKISEISETICHVDDYNSFCSLIKNHEEIMERVLNRKRIKSYYPDFEGEMKSLGAWGGDFFLVATEWDEDKVRKYFTNKGLDVIFRYNDIVLSR